MNSGHNLEKVLTTTEKDNRWWQGKRGEWYVIIQALIFLLLIFGPGAASQTGSARPITSAGGALLLLAGLILAVAGTYNLGKNLTPLPFPKDNAEFIASGAYRLVRHPIYGGIAIMAFGWSLWLHNWLKLIYAVLLFVFFIVKSHREEAWLMVKFPAYAVYKKSVRRLIPYLFLYY